MKKRILLSVVVLLLTISGVATGCAEPAETPTPTPAPAPQPAAEYPSQPIIIGCHSSPGAPNDLLARQIAVIGEKYFGVPMAVVNKKGGSGAVMLSWLIKQPADGHFMGTWTKSTIVNRALGTLPGRADDWVYLIRVQDEPYMICTLPDSPFNDISDVIAYAKEHPGKLTIGGAFGVEGAHYLAFAQLLKAAGLNPSDIRWVAFEGGQAEAMTSLLGGHIDMAQGNYGTVGELQRAGKVKVLGVSSAERVDLLPDVPTYKELGFDVVASHCRGVLCRKEVPKEIQRKMRELLKQTIHDPEFEEFMKSSNIIYADTFDSVEACTEWWLKEVGNLRVILQEAGVEVK